MPTTDLFNKRSMSFHEAAGLPPINMSVEFNIEAFHVTGSLPSPSESVLKKRRKRFESSDGRRVYALMSKGNTCLPLTTRNMTPVPM
jgi:hypothetical protein